MSSKTDLKDTARPEITAEPDAVDTKPAASQQTQTPTPGRKRKIFHWWTFGLICFNAFLERADEQALPALFPRLTEAFGVTPVQLAGLPATRGVVEAFAALLGGYMAHVINRKYCCSCGCLLYGVFTIQCALLAHWNLAYLYMIANGIGLALIIPASYSLMVDVVHDEFKGTAFGWQYATGAFGCGLASFVATPIGKSEIWNLTGWRALLLIIGAISVILGIFDAVLMKDPRFKKGDDEIWAVVAPQDSIWNTIKDLCGMPVMWWIIVQGVIGQMPFNCLVFQTLFLESLRLDKWQVSGILFWAGTALGGICGGALADRLAVYGDRWRIGVAQIGLALACVFAYALYQWIPRDPAHFAAYMGVAFAFGVTASWVQPACTAPIIAETIALNKRSCAYAMDRCLEAALGAFSPLVLGTLIQKLGWKDPEKFPGDSTKAENAKHMGTAMSYIIVSCWIVSGIVMSGLYYYYPKAKAEFEAAEEAANAEEISQPDDDDSEDSADEKILYPPAGAPENKKFFWGFGPNREGPADEAIEDIGPGFITWK